MTATTFGWLTLGAFLLWAGWVFGVKTLRSYRATGDLGIRRSTSTPVRQVALPLMVGGLTSVGVGALLAGIGVWTITAVPTLVQVVAAIAFVASAAGTVIAQRSMGRSWRIGVDPTEATTLVITGVFAIVRNPFFTTSITLTWAAVILAPTWPTLLGALAYTTGVNLQVRLDEEPALHALHGPAYTDYTRHVGRFIP